MEKSSIKQLLMAQTFGKDSWNWNSFLFDSSSGSRWDFSWQKWLVLSDNTTDREDDRVN